jgi:hypothetical protein
MAGGNTGDFSVGITRFPVWAGMRPSTSLWLYSTDAPIEQVLVHWENRHLLSSFTRQLTGPDFHNYILNRIRSVVFRSYISRARDKKEDLCFIGRSYFW